MKSAQINAQMRYAAQSLAAKCNFNKSGELELREIQKTLTGIYDKLGVKL